ncbi:MAG: TolC family outer membrane protein, partial [Alphaproteobacteria bacterium]
VTQNLYDGGQTTAATDRAENDIRAERARLDDTEQDLLLDVASAYMSVLRDQAVLELNRNNERVLGRQLDATSDRFDVGEVTRTDVAQAEARVSGSTADRIQAEGQLEISRAQYLRIVGKLPEALQDPPVQENLPKSRDEAITLATEGNPNVRAATFDQQSAQGLVRQIEGELLPTVDLVGRAQKSRNVSASDSSLDSLALTAQLTVPIYQQGEVTSRVREAKHMVSRSQQIIEEARRVAAEDAKSAWERLETARARRASLNSEVRAAQIALDGVRQEARVGSRTVLDVLDSEQELLDAQVDLVRAERDEVVARFEVLAAVGQLTARSIGLGAELYDPEVHYTQVRGKLWGLGEEIDGK